MHERSKLLDAVERALENQTVVDVVDAVQEEDLPCVVVEEREETMRGFDETLARPATVLRRRYRLVVFSFGATRRARDDLAETIERLITPAIVGAGYRCALVGVGFSRSRVGTGSPAHVAGQFYDAEYTTPTYTPA